MQEFFDLADALEKEKSFQNIFALTGTYCQAHAFEWLSSGSVQGMTYAEYKKTCRIYAAGLMDTLAGIQAGGRVGLMLPNGPEWCCTFWGLLMAGYCPVLIDNSASEDMALTVLEQAGAAALICEGAGPAGYRRVHPAELECGDAEAFAPRWADGVVFCSSGTECLRLCLFDGAAVAAQVLAARSMPAQSTEVMYPEVRGTARCLALLPMHHIFGFVGLFLWFTFFGRTLVFLEDRRPQTILETSRKLRVSHVFAVPLLWNGIAGRVQAMTEGKGGSARIARRVLRRAEALKNGMVSKPGLPERFLQRRLFGTAIRFMVSGGSYIPQETLHIVEAIGYPLHNGYGLTEAGVTSLELSPDPRLRMEGAAGYPLEGVEYRLEDGGLLIKSGYLYKGTYVAGEFRPREGEWLHTGDLAERMADGRYRILGRRTDFILGASGENISPELLESRFLRLTHVKHVCALGLKRPGGGERAALVIEPEGELDESTLSSLRGQILQASAGLPLYMQPETVYIAKQPIPLTGTQKPKRKALRYHLELCPLDFTLLNLHYSADALGRQASRETLVRVRAVMERVLEKSAGEITDTAHFVHDLGGDSFLYAALVVELEKEFSMHIPPESYAVCATAIAFAELLDKLGTTNS